MKIRHFWIKDKVASGELEIQHLPTDSMWANEARCRANYSESSERVIQKETSRAEGVRWNIYLASVYIIY